MATLENALRRPPEGSTPVVNPERITLQIPPLPNLGYYPAAASRGAVQVPGLSTNDNLRQYYVNGGAYRRFWPKQ